MNKELLDLVFQKFDELLDDQGFDDWLDQKPNAFDDWINAQPNREEIIAAIARIFLHGQARNNEIKK